MNKKSISLVVALMLVLQMLAVPLVAGAEASYVLFKKTDFSDVAAAPGLPIRIDGNPWLYKGSATTTEFTLQQEDGKYFGHFTSDSVKEGKAGEGSWYLYYRNQKNGMTENGYIEFDIRVNSGVIQFQSGSYTDPTKGADPCAVSIAFNADTKKIAATSANGKVTEIVSNFKAKEWYNVLIEIDNTNQQYTVTVKDKDSKVYKAEALSYVQSTSTAPIIFVFAYVRKANGHNFDLTNVSIVKGKYGTAPVETTAPTATPAATATAAPTTAPVKTAKFEDIGNHWAKDTIIAMYQADVINGISEKEFAPDRQIKRAEFIKLIVAMLKLDTKAAYAGPCTDVKSHWAAAYIQAAETAGLIDKNLETGNLLLPDQNITREEMASLVTLAAKYKGLDISGGSIDSFTDKSNISAWASSYVSGAVKLGIVNGMTDGSFSPKAEATRAQAAVMVSRLLDKVNKK
ncbi:MAG: S-layer homology domain-containing protein [Clostridia bacterium]|nr:S-layer homology domain-containing protein [Clostridia bacterium]